MVTNRFVAVLVCLIVGVQASISFTKGGGLSGVKILNFGDSLPGFKTTLSADGLNYVASVGVSLLEQEVDQISIPDLSGEADSFIGKIDWSLTNIVLDQLSLNSPSASYTQGGVNLQINGISCALTLNWQYKEHSWPHVSDHGTADISVSQSTASIVLLISEQNSRPEFTVLSDTISINNLDIKLHGGASWLYNFFVSVLSGPIKNAIQNALDKQLITGIDNGLNNALDTLPIKVPINKLLEIDFSLIASPTFTSTYATAPDLGEFYSIDNPVECPTSVCSQISDIPDTLTTEQLQMIISDFVAQSAGFALFQIGKLKAVVTNAELPSWAPIRMNTSYFVNMLPNLYDSCPDCAMELNLEATEAPQITFTSSGISGFINGNIGVITLNSTGSNQAFVLSGNISCSGDAILQGQNIYGNFTYQDSNFVVIDSTIGYVSVPLIDDLVSLLIKNGLVPEINEELAVGIPLPTVKGVSFTDPTVGYGDHYVYVSTDINYSPKEKSRVSIL